MMTKYDLNQGLGSGCQTTEQPNKSVDSIASENSQRGKNVSPLGEIKSVSDSDNTSIKSELASNGKKSLEVLGEVTEIPSSLEKKNSDQDTRTETVKIQKGSSDSDKSGSSKQGLDFCLDHSTGLTSDRAMPEQAFTQSNTSEYLVENDLEYLKPFENIVINIQDQKPTNSVSGKKELPFFRKTTEENLNVSRMKINRFCNSDSKKNKVAWSDQKPRAGGSAYLPEVKTNEFESNNGERDTNGFLNNFTQLDLANPDLLDQYFENSCKFNKKANANHHANQ